MRKITSIYLKIEKYLKRIIINIIKLVYCDIILKKSWLKKHNLNINWIFDDIDFNNYNYLFAVELKNCKINLNKK